MYMSCVAGHTQIALDLINNGCDVHRSDVQKTTTPFQEAVTRNQLQVKCFKIHSLIQREERT